MDHLQHFKQIQSFLKKYQYLWEMEIIERYPNQFPDWLNSLIDKLDQLSPKDLLKVENTLDYPNEYFQEIKKLCRVTPKYIPPNENEKLLKVTPKKKHEIQNISKFLKDKKSKKLVDFGGGVGHLSEYLCQNHNMSSMCIDRDKELQRTGLKRIKRYASNTNIHFTNLEIATQALKENSELSNFCDDTTLCIGLHACGPLTNYLMDFYLHSKSNQLLSFGCCYHKLTNEFNLSKIAKKDPLHLTKQALTLATRSYSPRTQDEVDFRWRVKKYRYALHMQMIDSNLVSHFATLGNSHASLYEQDFATYAKEQLSRLNMQMEIKPIDESLIRRYVLAGIIRGALGRLAELYINLDRVLYLEEQGEEVELTELFERELSPRNLAIYSKSFHN